MKKVLLSILIATLTFWGCKKPETVKPIVPRTVQINPEDLPIPDKPAPDREAEISGKIYINGTPMLKKMIDQFGTISEFFYNERKQLVRRHQQGDNLSVTDYLYFYDGGERVTRYDFVKNPNFVLKNSFGVLIINPIFCEYDSQGRIISSRSVSSKNTYVYENDGLLVKEFSVSYIETNPVTRLNSIKLYDKNNNNTEITQGSYMAKYTFDKKINPITFSAINKENNVLSLDSVGGWSGNDKEFYQYKYNQYNLPIERKDSQGNITTYTYYE